MCESHKEQASTHVATVLPASPAQKGLTLGSRGSQSCTHFHEWRISPAAVMGFDAGRQMKGVAVSLATIGPTEFHFS